MKKNLYFIIILSLFAFIGCTNDSDIIEKDNSKEYNGVPLEEKYVEQGVFRVKLNPQTEANLNIVTTRSGIATTGVAALDELINQLGVISIQRTFTDGGKFAERRRKAGLHLWYDIYFDKKQPMTRAFSDIYQIPGIDVIEPIYKVKRIGNENTPVAIKDVPESINTRSNNDLPKITSVFNDPYLKYQWHYHNEGILRHSLPGADINLYKAWEVETGKPQVIVAVIDGGVEIDHPDLIPNLWINTGELNGSDGDDDNNGYTNDIHGYNFVFPHNNDFKVSIWERNDNPDQGKVTPHLHGVHVAGTVAAASNNGLGGAGVAGGNGSADSGARIMSCQIFAYNEEGGEETAPDRNITEAFMYAAENGAVIAQCSWALVWTGSEVELPLAVKEGIDYFIENAGKDIEGNQTGPLDGGIVFFATGNDNVNAKTVPASYEKVFSVSSFTANYQRASYSNYGTWVTLTAPGGDGDYSEGTQVFSTYMGKQYGYQAGTSMACPHVAGIAALVVSKYGVDNNGNIIRGGLTNQQLWNKLLASTTDNISWYNSSAYPMGKGYIDAYKALVMDDPDYQGKIAPDRVPELEANWFPNKVKLSWKVTADVDDISGKAKGYKLFISESNLYGLDFSQLSSTEVVEVLINGKAIGETLTYEFNDTNSALETGKTYYISMAAFDKENNYSHSSTIQGSLIPNRAPVVEGTPTSVTLKKGEVKTANLKIYDIEGDTWQIKDFNTGSAAVTYVQQGDQLIITFNANAITPGQSFDVTFVVEDAMGAAKTISIPYSVINNAPVLLQNFEDILFQKSGETMEYRLTDYFIEKDNDAIVYTVESNNPEIATASESGGVH